MIETKNNPYYDDFDITKGFLKVLFKPGISVQTRELNQLQSILQSQIGQLADSIFKDGSVVKDGKLTFKNDVDYVKLFDSYGNLSKGTYQNKPSPDDCSYADDFYFSKGKNECNLVGWGYENKGRWQRGEYRFEIWYNNKCQYSKSFTIY